MENLVVNSTGGAAEDATTAATKVATTAAAATTNAGTGEESKGDATVAEVNNPEETKGNGFIYHGMGNVANKNTV